MKLAKDASFRFTPIADQRYATLLTHSSPGRCAPIATQQWPERRMRDHLIMWSRHIVDERAE